MKHFLPHIIIALVLLSPAWASADILVVQSLPIKPYEDALRGFRSVCKQRINRVVGPELSESSITENVHKGKPDLILAIGMDALLKLKMIREVPIVYVMVLNPQTIARDGNNLTGVSMNLAPERQLSLLREVLPNLRKICIFYDPGKSGPYMGRVSNAATLMGIELLTRQVRSSRDAIAAIEGIKGRVDALWLLPDTTVVNPSTIDLLLLSSIENKIPVITFSEKYAEKGALLSLEVDAVESGKQAGEMAERILAGKNLSVVKDEDAREANLTINMIVAKKLGIPIKTNITKHARIIK
ncbi:MAG TPA: ABC transporter substrate-binding protein [Geobacteraceae bacterium]|nr:ABC transporter substrate-binding protein [Geobacteraceae bacterium]